VGLVFRRGKGPAMLSWNWVVWDVGILGFWMFPPVGSHGDDVSAFEFTLMRGASVFVFLGVGRMERSF
jgi:hypothetical protein